MIPDEVWGLVPDKWPPDAQGWMERLAYAAKLNSFEARAYAWATHLLSRLRDQAVTTTVMGIVSARPTAFPEVVDISAGFIPYSAKSKGSDRPLREARMEPDTPVIRVGDLGYSFGVVIGISPPSPEYEAKGVVELSPSQVVAIEGFPIVLEYRRVIPAAPPHPSGATSTCYAKPRASKRFFGPIWSSGIVIARHPLGSLGFSIGVSVPMTSGSSLPVVDIDASNTIDAAILDCAAFPRHAAPLNLAPAVAPGSNVDVRHSGGTFSAQVLRINDHPNYFGNMFGHRLFLDTVGSTGHSGSLVSRRPQSDSAGLYMGSTGGSAPEGLAQSMRQVVQYFDVDLFD